MAIDSQKQEQQQQRAAVQGASSSARHSAGAAAAAEDDEAFKASSQALALVIKDEITCGTIDGVQGGVWVDLSPVIARAPYTIFRFRVTAKCALSPSRAARAPD